MMEEEVECLIWTQLAVIIIKLFIKSWNTKEDILKNIVLQTTLDPFVIVWHRDIFQNIFFKKEGQIGLKQHEWLNDYFIHPFKSISTGSSIPLLKDVSAVAFKPSLKVFLTDAVSPWVPLRHVYTLSPSYSVHPVTAVGW